MAYNPQRKRNLFCPIETQTKPYKISRSKIDLFFDCPRCFYLDRRIGIGRPPSIPFNLNNAVDTLLKKEFDVHRAHQTVHPLVKENGLEAIPFAHEELDKWRENFVGIQHIHPEMNFTITGAVDDVWINKKKELIIVDYKATSKDGPLSIDSPWQISYKRQMEIYQWLFRQKGFTVSSTGYFVYCNANRNREGFDYKLHFDIQLIPYTGDDSWIHGTLKEIRDVLSHSEIPEANPECSFCAYRKQTRLHEKTPLPTSKD